MIKTKQLIWRDYLLLNFNPVIRWLTISDFILASSYGLIAPIFAIFASDYIKGGNVQIAGVAMTIFLLTKSLAQIPAASIIDKIKGEKDDFWVLIIGSILTAIIPLFYILTRTPAQLFLIQFINGIVTAATFPSWMAIFTRHIDKNKEGMEWGIYFTLTDLSSAITGAVGGTLALYFGFNIVFIGVSVISLIGSVALILIKNEVRKGRRLDNYLPAK